MIKQIATEVFKCLNNISYPIYIHELVSKRYTDNYYFRYMNSIDIPRAKTATHGKKSFALMPHKNRKTVWNGFPNDLRSSTKINVFKELNKTWSGPSGNVQCVLSLVCGLFY